MAARKQQPRFRLDIQAPLNGRVGKATVIVLDAGLGNDGLIWGGDAGNTGIFSIKNNTGQLNNGSGSSYSAVLGPSATNAQVVANSNGGDWRSGFSNAIKTTKATSSFSPSRRRSRSRRGFPATSIGGEASSLSQVSIGMVRIISSCWRAPAGRSNRYSTSVHDLTHRRRFASLAAAGNGPQCRQACSFRGRSTARKPIAGMRAACRRRKPATGTLNVQVSSLAMIGVHRRARGELMVVSSGLRRPGRTLEPVAVST